VNETVQLRLVVRGGDPEGLELKATALRESPTEPWYIFVSPRDSGLWVLFAETITIYPQADPKGAHGTILIDLDPEVAIHLAKLAVFIGDPWDRIYAETQAALAYQQHAIDHLGPKMRAKLDNSSLEDLAAYRDEINREPIHSGEIVRQQIDPLAGRN
jgi:hypothetical protein